MRVVPDDDRSTRWLGDKGVLLSCSEDSWSWSTSSEIEFTHEEDLQAWLHAMRDAATAQEGVSAHFTTTGLGQPRLEVVDDHGTNVYADARKDGRRLALGVFSPCITDLADYAGTTFY